MVRSHSSGWFFLMILLIGCNVLYAQEVSGRKKIMATRVIQAPQMDGKMSDPIWQLSEKSGDFFQYEPHNDRPATFKTEVSILYSDYAIYIGAKLHDPEASKILTELGLRDADSKLNADQFWVDINPFNDGIYGFRFKVSASGVQTDINLTGGSGGSSDLKWDGVWESHVAISQDGWTVEMEIPYSALRFPKGDLNEWGINFWREVRRTRETSSWNPVNKSIESPLTFMGLLHGMEGIKPPLRLAFFPYVSAYVENHQAGDPWSRSFSGGMDIKYGIDESFTLDLTLIPDFGQVQSDALVLNLTPFEIKYDEKRQFFTEGTELYNKADLFYSRRVGSKPKAYGLAYDNLQEHEIVSYNPIETRLLNATKLSGRTDNGLGIGVFNSITAQSQAEIFDTVKDISRMIVTQPLTNYNLFVLDKSLPNHSYFSLINTNVTGSRPGYIANVTGTEFLFRDKSKKYAANVVAALSQKYNKGDKANLGFKYNVFLGKTGGKWQYYYNREVLSDRYDQNDLGYQKTNNEIEDEIGVSYNIFKPFWKVISTSSEISMEYSRLFEPNTFTGMSIDYDFRMLFLSRFFISFSAELEPLGKRDYFEPRVAGRFYETGTAYDLYTLFSSDYRKRLFVDGTLRYEKVNSAEDMQSFSINFLPTFRINDRFNVSYGLYYQQKLNDIGYVNHKDPATIIFGLRRSPTTSNSVKSSYIFNNSLSIDLILRQYWSRVFYKGAYYLLKEDGKLTNWDNHVENSDINYNAITIDLKLIWNFSPGSQLSLVWKNLIDSNRNEIPESYLQNLSKTLQEPQINSLSMKLLYYIDYQQINSLFHPQIMR